MVVVMVFTKFEQQRPKLNKNNSRFEVVANLFVFDCPNCQKRADEWCSNDYFFGKWSVLRQANCEKPLHQSTSVGAYPINWVFPILVKGESYFFYNAEENMV